MQINPLSVLVVDDDAQMLRTTTDILRLHGYTPLPAASGLTALELAGTLPTAPSIALVDLQLPDMDGIELVSRLRALSSVTEVVILTGNATMESAVSAMREQSYDYLIKPVQPDYLMATIDRAGERSERRRAEAGREASEQRLQLIFEHVSDALFIADDAGYILDANPAACELTGLTVDELRAAALHDVLPESAGAAVADTDLGPASERKETRKPRDPGEARTLDVQAEAFAPGVLVYTVRDLTQQRRLEEQLAQSQKMEAIGQLAGGVAHDFNNLLTVILSYSGLLLNDLPADDPRRADVQEIADAADRGSGLTRQLLAFSRKQVMQLRAVNVNNVVGGIENMLRRLIGEDIELTTALDPELAHVSGDTGQLEQVLINLAVNARDAMPDGGRLHISTGNTVLSVDSLGEDVEAPPGAYVVLSVTDTGIGMTRETQQRVFEPFFTTKAYGKGTGLGLSTIYGIVKQFGGAVTIDSKPGSGTTFHVYFPRTELGDGAAPLQRGATEPTGGSETVLIVEDDTSLRNLTARVLRKHGYTVLTAANGAEAWDISSQHEGSIDIVVTDVVMPEMGGRLLVERLHEARSGIRVLFMSGHTTDEVIRRGVLDGRTAFLQKPFTPDEFASTVREVLDSPKWDAKVAGYLGLGGSAAASKVTTQTM